MGLQKKGVEVLLGALARNSRTALRLEALTLTDNDATEEFGHFGTCIYMYVFV